MGPRTLELLIVFNRFYMFSCRFGRVFEQEKSKQMIDSWKETLGCLPLQIQANEAARQEILKLLESKNKSFPPESFPEAHFRAAK